MLRRFIFKAIFIGAMAFAGSSYAETDHAHAKGPNGGEVKTFGKEFHLEAVRSGNEVSFHLLGSDGKTSVKIDKHEGGNVMIVSPGTKPDKKTIEKGTSLDTVRIQLANSKKSSVTLTLKVDGKALLAKFSL